MASYGTRRLGEALDRVGDDQQFSDEQVETFATTGALALKPALPEGLLGILAGSCQRAIDRPLLPYTRSAKGRGWHHVEKITLFRDPQNLKELSHSMAAHAPELTAAASWIDDTVHKLGNGLLDAGYPEAAALMQGHTTSRAIVHRMKGQPGRPASIGKHTDPHAERGANAALAFDPGVSLVDHEPIAPNTLNIYACYETTQALGIREPVHGFSAESQRLSVVFTNFQV